MTYQSPHFEARSSLNAWTGSSVSSGSRSPSSSTVAGAVSAASASVASVSAGASEVDSSGTCGVAPSTVSVPSASVDSGVCSDMTCFLTSTQLQQRRRTARPDHGQAGSAAEHPEHQPGEHPVQPRGDRHDEHHEDEHDPRVVDQLRPSGPHDLAQLVQDLGQEGPDRPEEPGEHSALRLAAPRLGRLRSELAHVVSLISSGSGVLQGLLPCNAGQEGLEPPTAG